MIVMCDFGSFPACIFFEAAAQPFGFGHHVLDAPQAIEQRVFSVYVQMDKIAGHKFTIIQESNADAE